MTNYSNNNIIFAYNCACVCVRIFEKDCYKVIQECKSLEKLKNQCLKSLSEVAPMVQKYSDLQGRISLLSFSAIDTHTYESLRAEAKKQYQRIVDTLPISKKVVEELTGKIEEGLTRIERCAREWRELGADQVGKVQPSLRNVSKRLDNKLRSLEGLVQKCKNHLSFTPFLELYKKIRKADMRCQLLKEKRVHVQSELRCEDIEHHLIEEDEMTLELKDKYAKTCKALNDKIDDVNRKYRNHRKQWRHHIKTAIAMSQTNWFPEVVILDWIFFQQLQNGLYAYGGVLSEQKAFLLKYCALCVYVCVRKCLDLICFSLSINTESDMHAHNNIHRCTHISHLTSHMLDTYMQRYIRL